MSLTQRSRPPITPQMHYVQLLVITQLKQFGNNYYKPFSPMLKTPFSDTYDNQYPSKHQQLDHTITTSLVALKKHLISNLNDNANPNHNLAPYEALIPCNNFVSKGELYHIVLQLIGVVEEIRMVVVESELQELLRIAKENLMRMYKAQIRTTVDLFALFSYLASLDLEDPSSYLISRNVESQEETQNDALYNPSHCSNLRTRAKTSHSMASQKSSKSTTSVKVDKVL